MKTEILGTKNGIEYSDSDLAIDWGVASLQLPGQTESGDQFVVRAFNGGVLIGVIDGLGHGSEAAAASKIAVLMLEKHAREPVASLINLCHKELRTTRGAVMTLASINARANTLTWIAVGNVVAVLRRNRSHATPSCEYVLMGAGLVGDRLPALRASTVPISKGDILILATDGVRETFVGEPSLQEHPSMIAGKILTRYAKRNDEGLVLVVRYTGVLQ